MTETRHVTEDDIKLVHQSMMRRETGQLRLIGLLAEIVGWLALLAALLFAVLQWDELDAFSDRSGNPIEQWRAFVGFLLPTMMNMVVAGATLILLGRGARMFALHLAARRGLNLTGLALGESLDVAEGDASLPDEPWRG